MLYAGSPVIQVVTTGVDWPAIAAVISTGRVGLAGISVTLWQTICLRPQTEPFKDSPTKAEPPPDYQTVRLTTTNAIGKIHLIAPDNIKMLANEVGNTRLLT